MVRIQNAQELLYLFRPIDRDLIVIAREIQFPFSFVDLFSWKEPSGHRTYLLFEDKVNSESFGVVFERSKGGQNVPAMCDWCHAVRPASDVALMTTTVSPTKRVGLYICADISCKQNLLDSPSINDMRETLGQNEKLVRLMNKIRNFVQKKLF